MTEVSDLLNGAFGARIYICTVAFVCRGPGRSRAGSGDDGLATLKKNIGDMGDTMKRRLNDMYSRFVKSREGARDQSHVPLMDNGDDEVRPAAVSVT